MTSTHADTHRAAPLFRRGAATLACAALLVGPAVAATAGPAAAAPAPAAVPSRVTPSDGPASPLQQAARTVLGAGAVGYVARVDDGRRVTTTVAGLADRATGRGLRADDQFEIGSNTKVFVATLAMQLVARGEISLDDTVQKLLPGVVPGGDRITLRMLLQHTSGLFNYTADTTMFRSVLSDPKRLWTPAELVAVAVKHPPNFAPGTSWAYSNTNYVLVGMILERATGRPLSELLEQRIVRPLGLRHTLLVTDVATHTGPGYAHGYVATFGAGGTTYADVSTWALGGWAGAAGAVVSTPSELGRFLSALLGGRLVPAAQLAQMRRTVPLPKDFGGIVGGYGLGLMRIDTACGTVWGHGGDTLGHHSTLAASPDGRKVAVTDTTTQPDSIAGATPGAVKLLDADHAAELTATCQMLGKPTPSS